jgi:quercetin dioxygenase-like cupin family protein
MNIQGKVWGQTQPLFLKNNVEIHRIEAKQGGYCSKHKHEHKYNAFFVERGQLKITIWKNDYDLVDETIISDQQMSTVKPHEYHMFEAMKDTIAYEIYWTEIESDDIVRECRGGMQ